MFEWIESLRIDAAAGAADARAHVPDAHPFLADHFPGHPILPGSLQIELGAQVAGALAEELVSRRDGTPRWSFLGMVRHATFHVPVSLPAQPAILARAERIERDSVLVNVELYPSAGELACRAALVMVLLPAQPGWEEAEECHRARIAQLKARAP
jgi:3-hydroxymyristoyl/3-hydroxydecanoyl-(acyl carrier protein) dehydratase